MERLEPHVGRSRHIQATALALLVLVALLGLLVLLVRHLLRVLGWSVSYGQTIALMTLVELFLLPFYLLLGQAVRSSNGR